MTLLPSERPTAESHVQFSHCHSRQTAGRRAGAIYPGRWPHCSHAGGFAGDAGCAAAGQLRSGRGGVGRLAANVLRVGWIVCLGLTVRHTGLAVGDIGEWDSLAHLRIIAAVEREFEIRLDDEEMLDIETIRDIVKLLQAKRL